MKPVIIISILAISILILNVNLIFSDQTESSKIRLHQNNSIRIDGGQPLVFVGKLTTNLGEPINNATISIKNNQNCPSDQIIGTGLTDKTGRFYVYMISEIWNEEDNLVKFHAEFYGDEKYSTSISNDVIYVIHPSLAEKCEIEE